MRQGLQEDLRLIQHTGLGLLNKKLDLIKINLEIRELWKRTRFFKASSHLIKQKMIL
jgi:hypothetical protein